MAATEMKNTTDKHSVTGKQRRNKCLEWLIGLNKIEVMNPYIDLYEYKW